MLADTLLVTESYTMYITKSPQCDCTVKSIENDNENKNKVRIFFKALLFSHIFAV